MDLDHAACYRVLQARDRRFDGRLFVAVKTTGIYCRPICPARTPKSVNVIFFTTAAAAAEAGFRPCLRCRPEVSPDLAMWNGTSNTVTRALRLIEAGALDEQDLEALATRLGVGARHLRRLFSNHLGASPMAVLQTRRVHLAKQLLHETELPMIDVALAAGFRSVRRFNETFKTLFGRPPSSLRRRRSLEASGRDAITLQLPYSAPYAWPQMLQALARDAITGVESILPDGYARSFAVDNANAAIPQVNIPPVNIPQGDISRTDIPRAGSPHATIQGVVSVRNTAAGHLLITVHCSDVRLLQSVIVNVRRVFDLAADPSVIDASLRKDATLARLVAAHPGLRAPGTWDSTELCWRAVLRHASSESSAGFAERYGEPLPPRLAALYPGVTHTLPSAARIVRSGHASEVLAVVARFICAQSDWATARSDVLTLTQQLRGAQVPAALAHDIATAQLQPSDAFNMFDVQLREAVMQLTGRAGSDSHCLNSAEPWRTWRAYAAAHLLAADTRSRVAAVLERIAV